MLIVVSMSKRLKIVYNTVIQRLKRFDPIHIQYIKPLPALPH